MEYSRDGIFVGNESQMFTGMISGDSDEGNAYEDWTDLNGNTLAIALLANKYRSSRGFELEFKCSDQFEIPICSLLMVHHN